MSKFIKLPFINVYRIISDKSQKVIHKKRLTAIFLKDIIISTAPDTPLNNADQVGSFDFRRKK